LISRTYGDFAVIISGRANALVAVWLHFLVARYLSPQ
jgi:hypothetical protein